MGNAGNFGEGVPHITRVLSDAGYRTGFVGKWHVAGVSKGSQRVVLPIYLILFLPSMCENDAIKLQKRASFNNLTPNLMHNHKKYLYLQLI